MWQLLAYFNVDRSYVH